MKIIIHIKNKNTQTNKWRSDDVEEQNLNE